MFDPPEHYPNLSLSLSEVLDDIGVNETMVIKKRRAEMLAETMLHIKRQLALIHTISFYFGSQTEASSTVGLNSDHDNLSIYTRRVIQDWSEWKKGDFQFLMVQDETTSPGYCLLQLVRHDRPLPVIAEHQDKNFIPDSKGRVLVRHKHCFPSGQEQLTIHGPARTFSKDGKVFDLVQAFYCSTWPREAIPWLHQQNASGWPTEDMKKYSEEQGCFLVPVASKNGAYHDCEWRISTSFAERCLMFNINITQLRCYILMKMIIKTFLKPKCGDTVSSYICKNILFHCISNSRAGNSWTENSLLTWLNQCLQDLLNYIEKENCPHFIIPRNNLLAGKLSREVKHQLVEVMRTLTGNLEQSLLIIDIDDLGNRLYVKSSVMSVVHSLPAYDMCVKSEDMKNQVLDDLLAMIISYLKKLSKNSASVHESLTNDVSKLCKIYNSGNPLQKMASRLITPFICTIVGSTVASVDIQQTGRLSREAMDWFSFGSFSDISCKLKLTSALYCAGDLVSCQILLLSLRRQMEQSTMHICHCIDPYAAACKANFFTLIFQYYEHEIMNKLALCVRYLPCEVNCIPNEMKYEMFRSTEEERQYRNDKDYWMDWAAVDCFPYLFFLQYKVNRQLGRPADKYLALENLARTTASATFLGHRETAWNLLGQCMEQEMGNDKAFYCYMMSLKVRARNNAAKWHACSLLCRLAQVSVG